MLKTVIIATHPNRRTMLRECLNSLAMYAPSWKVVVYENEIGPSLARRRMLAENESDVWCVVDDDMVLTEGTRWGPAAAKCLEEGVGLVSCNWVRSRKSTKKSRDIFVKQPIVFTGGGMIFCNRVKSIILDEPATPWRYDNPAWSVACYLRGLENFRFLGSVCVHRICSAGGRKTYVDSLDTVAPDGRWFNYRPGHIPLSSDLTKQAREHHAFAKRQALAGRP